MLWSSSGGSAWLTAGNWTGSAVPTGTQIAQFGTNPTSATTGVGINFNNTTNAGVQINGQRIQEVGAVEITSARTNNFLIGNSASATNATGIFRLNGATVGSVSNAVLVNGGSGNFTIQNTQASGNQTMAVVLANANSNNVVINGSGNITISSNISGANRKLGVQGTGTGDLILSGTNIFTGGIDISGSGKLRLGAATALPTTGDISIAGDGRLRFAAAGTYGASSQTITISPTGTTNSAIDFQTNNIAVTLNPNIAFAADSRIEVNGATGALTLAGNVSGSGALVKQGAGNLVLAGTGNTATGGTQIGNGTITVNAGSSLGTGALTLAQTGTNSATVTFNNASQTIAGLASSWSATTGTIDQRVNLGGTSLTINQATNSSFGNGAVSTLTSTIAGSGSIIKTGAGTLTLDSTNTYTGSTTINGGTLALGANGSLASTSISVGTNGTFDVSAVTGGYNLLTGRTLSGDGTIVGNVNVNTGAFLNPGTSPGSLAFTGDLTNSGTITIELNSATEFDSILGNGSNVLTLGGTLNIITNFTPVVGQTFNVFSGWQNIVGNFSTINGTNLGGGLSWQISTSGGNLSFSSVPEPSSLALLGLVGLGGFAIRRYRKQKIQDTQIA